MRSAGYGFDPLIVEYRVSRVQDSCAEVMFQGENRLNPADNRGNPLAPCRVRGHDVRDRGRPATLYWIPGGIENASNMGITG